MVEMNCQKKSILLAQLFLKISINRERSGVAKISSVQIFRIIAFAVTRPVMAELS